MTTAAMVLGVGAPDHLDRRRCGIAIQYGARHRQRAFNRNPLSLFVVPAAYVMIAKKTEVVTERLKKADGPCDR